MTRSRLKRIKRKDSLDGGKVALLLSGGLCSTSLLYHFLARHPVENVHCLTINYGQKNRKEIDCASALCRALDVSHFSLKFQGLSLIWDNCCLTDPGVPIPETHFYEDVKDSLELPSRNAVLTSLLTAFATSKGCGTAAAVFPQTYYLDSDRNYLQSLSSSQKMLAGPELVFPLRHLSRDQVVAEGLSLGMPLDWSWSCHRNRPVHCGFCVGCQRRRAVMLALSVSNPKIKDKVSYARNPKYKPEQLRYAAAYLERYRNRVKKWKFWQSRNTPWVHPDPPKRPRRYAP